MKPRLSVWKNISIFVYDKTSEAATPAATVLNLRTSPNNNMIYSNLIVTGSVNRAGTAKFTATNPGRATNAEKSLFSDDYCAVGVAPTEKYIAIIAGQDLIWSGKMLRSVSTTQVPFNSTQTFSQWEVECESDIGKMKLQEVNPPTPPTVVGRVGEVINAILRKKSSSDVDWTGFHPGSSPLLWDSVISNEGGVVSYKVLDSDMYTQFMSIVKLSGFEWKTRLLNWVEDYNAWNPVTKVLGIAPNPYSISQILNRWVLFLGDSGVGGNIISYGQVGSTSPVIDWNGGTGNVSSPLRTNTWQAQMFYPTKSTILGVTISMRKVGLPTNVLTIDIVKQTIPGGALAGTVVATNTFTTNQLTTSFADYYISLPCDAQIGAQYWITVKTNAGMLVNKEAFLNIRQDNIGLYRSWGAGAWTNADMNYVYDFKTHYGAPVLKNVVNPTLMPAHPGTYRACTFLNGGNYVYTGATYRPAVNSVVVFADPVPAGIVAGKNYCVVESSYDFIRLSDTLGGTPIVFEQVTVDSTFAVATFNSGRCMLLLDPVVDVAWDLEQIIPVQVICANRSGTDAEPICFSYSDNTDKKLVATKITVKGKNIDTSESSTGRSDSISTTLYAVNKWEPEATMFENSTVVSMKMDGYLYSCASASTDLYLIGQDYAIQNNDTFDVYCKWLDGSTPELITNRTVSSVTLVTQPDGTKTTKLVINSQLSGSKSAAKYSVFLARKTYVQDPSRLYDALPSPSVWFGGSTSSGNPAYKSITSVGTDTARGKWIYGIASFASGETQVRPFLPGCLVSRKRGGETPQPGSPIALLGTIALTETVDQATTLGDLEVYATQSLINHSFYLRKAAFKCFINNFTKHGDRGYGQIYDWQFIKEGDRIAVNPTAVFPVGQSLNDKYFDGQFKYLWEVISWTLDSNTMTVTAELGDYEPNVNILINDKTQSLDRTIS